MTAGPAGLATGHELLAHGFDNFTIFEATDAVGETWHLHSYPGLACDVWATPRHHGGGLTGRARYGCGSTAGPWRVAVAARTPLKWDAARTIGGLLNGESPAGDVPTATATRHGCA